MFSKSQTTKAQSTFGYLVANNCWQRVAGNLSNTGHFRFINSPDGRHVVLTATNLADLPTVNIYEYNSSNIPVLINQNVALPSTFDFPTTSNKFLIKPNQELLSRYFYWAQDIEIEFVTPIIDVFDAGKPCLTFDVLNFQFNINLDGLCRTPELKLKFPPIATNTGGLPGNWFRYVENGEHFNIPIDPAYCETLPEDPNPHIYCLDFELEVTIWPCPDMEALGCLPITLNKILNICCSCDLWDPIQE